APHLKSNQFVGTRQPEAVDGGSRWRGGRTEHEAPAGTIGTDESGKGDYFGPLVVAGVCVPAGGREVLAALGVRDSKTLSDGQAERLARAGFLRRLDALSARFGLPLPKGAGPPVLAAGRAFVARHGADALGQVAKLHFRTTRQVTGAGA